MLQIMAGTPIIAMVLLSCRLSIVETTLGEFVFLQKNAFRYDTGYIVDALMRHEHEYAKVAACMLLTVHCLIQYGEYFNLQYQMRQY